MTFKHVKFEDSAVMRSLEKVAREKGLIKEEDLVKIASEKKTSLVPTTNLLSNLLKLSEGLRDAGFDKYANELETNALAYKRAQTLYETSKETGDDLVDAAHPKGSHKLEGVDSAESVFETIIDQHLKHIEMTEKKPTGKLASSLDVLRAVKMALADGDANTGLTQPVINYVMSFFKNMDESLGSNWNYFTGMSSDGVLAYNRLKSNFMKYMNTRTINNATLASLNSTIDEAIKGFSSRDASRLFYVSDEAEKIVFQLKGLKNYIADTVIDDHKSLIAAAPKPNESIQQFTSQVDAALATLKSWTITVTKDPDNSPADITEAMKWINDRTAELTSLKNDFSAEKDPEEQSQKAPGFVGALAKSRFTKENAQFKKVWIG